MSRLDSFIRRVTAQRDCLNRVAEIIEYHEGLILEMGLGNGRTYDHLRELFPGREIYVFERTVSAHPDCVPDERHLIVGDLFETLPETLDKLGREVIFAHADLGSGNPAVDATLARFVAEILPPYLLPNGVVLSDQDLKVGTWWEDQLPSGVMPRRYFMYRAG